jgi:signal transduction histidine kinase
MDVPQLRHEVSNSAAPARLGNDETVVMFRPTESRGRAAARATLPERRGTGDPTAGTGPAIGPSLARRLRQRKLSHDIRHELATIMLLASLVETAPDAGPDSRQRARQILGEARWLQRLHSAYDSTVSLHDDQTAGTVELIPLDIFAAEVLAAVRLATSTPTSVTTDEAWVRADRLACWRALRNMVDNAVRAAGPNGKVELRVDNHAEWVVTQVDDDGPGFGAVPPGSASLGLDIVRDFAAASGGHLEIGRSALGGCRVRLSLPADTPDAVRS